MAFAKISRFLNWYRTKNPRTFFWILSGESSGHYFRFNTVLIYRILDDDDVTTIAIATFQLLLLDWRKGCGLKLVRMEWANFYIVLFHDKIDLIFSRGCRENGLKKMRKKGSADREGHKRPGPRSAARRINPIVIGREKASIREQGQAPLC